ncbi:hypothetical protein TNCV_2267521 [Trichonephila clavipes]|nr:hypothetical protein TNCV_2267521 [Trichonephila clavipes]
MNDAIIEIKMAPHKPRKSAPEQDSEDMLEYNPDEFNPDDYVQKDKADGPISYRNTTEGDAARLDFNGAV